MSKEADLIQAYNDEKREYEYFVKGFDVTESIRVLLKAHKEAYDKERRVFTECKAYCDAEKEFKERIADLEEKLAESEKNYKDARELGIEQFHSLKEIINSSQEEIDKLKQQLAEKEKEIEDMSVSSDWQSLLILKQEIEILQTENKVLKQRNQDKISFAVAELEKAKIEFETYYADNIWNYPQYLEDRITELTHQHEDKGE